MNTPTEPRVVALRHIANHLAGKMPSGSCVAWRAVVAETIRMADLAEALSNVHSARDPTAPLDAHIKKVSIAAQKLAKQRDVSNDRLHAIVKGGLDDIDTRIKAKVQLHPDAWGQEIRAVYARLTPPEQIKMLSTFVAENRGPELAALIRAPRSVTGMSDDLRQKFEKEFVAKNAPEESAEQEALMSAFNDAQVSIRTAGEVATVYSDPAALARITQAEEAAAAAAKVFDGAVSGA